MDDLKTKVFDFIVVGSGPSGTMCAQTLAESGRQVLMLDAGIKPSYYDEHDGSFESHREAGMHEIFLGRNLEGVDWGPPGVGSQITPSRKYVLEKVRQHLPIRSENFYPIRTLAYEGLGAVWGLGCSMFSDYELRKAGLPVSQMHEAYQVVANRIGISYTPDDIAPYTIHGLTGLQPAIRIDDNAIDVLRQYQLRKTQFQKRHFYLGAPSLALLTEDRDFRKATTYENMDFYYNRGLSAYRPSITLSALSKRKNFVYQNNILVNRFAEHDGYVVVDSKFVDDESPCSFRAKRLILACNVFSTAAIATRSLAKIGERLPLLCNPYSYTVCLQWKRLGKIPSPRRTSTVQLMMFHDRGGNEDVAMASLYSYSSLGMFRIVKELPINFRNGVRLLRDLLPAIIIAGIHHPISPSSGCYLSFIKEENQEFLLSEFSLPEEYLKGLRARERQFDKAFIKLGCFPLKKVTAPYGASAHYAGTLPFSTDEVPLTTQRSGRLSCTKNIFIADGSPFQYLPAKGVTFSLMAHAHCTALNALKDE